MNHRLVETSIKILRLFSNSSLLSNELTGETSLSRKEVVEKTGLGVNEIISLISKDRTHIIEVLEILQRENLLISDEKWTPGKKKKLRPTEIGLELINLMENIHQFNQEFLHFLKTFSEYENRSYSQKLKEFDSSIQDRKKTMTSIDYDNYRKEVIQRYNNAHEKIFEGKINLERWIISALIQSYMRICNTYPLTSKAQLILREIVLYEIDIILKSILKEKIQPKKSKEEMIYNLFGNALQKELFGLFVNENNLKFNESLYYEMRKCILSLLSILKPMKKHTTGYIMHIRPTIVKPKSLEQLLSPKQFKKVDLDNINELNNIYEEYFKREQAFKKLLEYYKTEE